MHFAKRPEPKHLQRKRSSVRLMKQKKLEEHIWFDCDPMELMTRFILELQSPPSECLSRICAAERVCELVETLTPFGIRHIAIGGPAVAEPQKGDRVARVVVWINDSASMRIEHGKMVTTNAGVFQMNRVNEALSFDTFRTQNKSHLSITLLEGPRTSYHPERFALDLCGDADLEHRRSSLLFCKTVSVAELRNSLASLCNK